MAKNTGKEKVAACELAYPGKETEGSVLASVDGAPELEPVEGVRPHFKRMKELFDRFFADRPGARLSMGMSRDYEIAVEEGATHVRIGSSIFS